jgi:hypothetical protein
VAPRSSTPENAIVKPRNAEGRTRPSSRKV